MFRVVFLLCILSTLSEAQDIVTPKPDAKAFRKDYKFVPATDMFYKAHRIPLKFQDAVNMCRYEGAEMAVPKTEGEATILTDLFNDGVGHVWIGLHDLYAEGQFMTLDGTSIDEIYDKWSPGEPNNVNEEEHCVVMTKNKELNDVECKHKYYFICSKPESQVKYDWLCESHDSGYFYNIEGDRCYKVHSTARTWHEAYKVCKAEEASLMVVNSAKEAKFLSDTLRNVQYANLPAGGARVDPNYLHVDFSDLVTPGTFVTSDGKTLSSIGYDEWIPGQPDNHLGNEHCGSVDRSGRLNDIDCGVKCMFFCEKVLGTPQLVSLLQRAGYNKTNESPKFE